MFADESQKSFGMPNSSGDVHAEGSRTALRRLRGRQLPGSAGQLGRDKSGATLIEFSLIAFLLIFVISATIEIAFVYWATEQLENGSGDAARLVRTGQAQSQSLSQAQLKGAICQRARILPDCTTRLRLDVQSAETFAQITPPDPFDGNGDLKSDNDFSYSPGGPNSISLLTAFYSWPIGFFGGPYLLRASTPMRNEPFEQ